MSSKQVSTSLNIVIVGGYPLYRLGLIALFDNLQVELNIRELGSWAETVPENPSVDLVCFFSYRDAQRFVEACGAGTRLPKMLLFSPYARLGQSLSKIPAQETIVLPLAISLQDAENYIRLLLEYGAEHVNKQLQYDQHIKQLFYPDPLSLTRREREVMHYIREGLDNDRIAEEMRIEKNTVKSFIQKIYRKFGVLNRTQAACVFTSSFYANY
ncbi:response regulator transcription factor [Marinobacterium jannaschii]|uniref:response regulator transcription factor n=1 Tax=Marinobacterium jannaschii TaxID=64970 RepID=UPI000484ECC5|nr:LuxR C-terminal-related transcriptional regulator [Marinobacterium jannaschii]